MSIYPITLYICRKIIITEKEKIDNEYELLFCFGHLQFASPEKS